MISGVSEDDILMEIVMLIGSICHEAECCSLIEGINQDIYRIVLTNTLVIFGEIV